MSPADGATAVIGIQDDRLEGALAETVWGKARVAEDWPGPVPWLAQIHIYDSAQDPVQELAEVGCHQGIGEVVALPLNDVGSEPGRRFHVRSSGKNRTSRTNLQPMTGSSSALTCGYLLIRASSARRSSAVGFAEELPGFRDPQLGRVAEKPSADDLVVRVMGLEEERLAWRERTEPVATTGLPEIDLRHLRPGGQKPVPLWSVTPTYPRTTIFCTKAMSAWRPSPQWVGEALSATYAETRTGECLVALISVSHAGQRRAR